MARLRRSRTPIPLDAKHLEEVALRYVGRYATSKAKLIGYLSRKVRERGWSESIEPDLESLAERFSALGYVDDAAYALARSRALASRGYGRRRLDDKLRVAGIGEDDAAEAREYAKREAVDAALRYAERRRIGPFGHGKSDPKAREKAIGAMVRAGHAFALAREIAGMPAGSAVDTAELCERAGISLT